MCQLLTENGVLTICNDEQYVLSDWDVSKTAPTSYFSRMVSEMKRHGTTDSVLMVGLAGGSIVGELMSKVHKPCRVVSLEIDMVMIEKGYNVLSKYFPVNPLIQHEILHCDFFAFDRYDVFSCIVVDIPHVYENSDIRTKKKVMDQVMLFAQAGTLCLFNTLSYDNSRDWASFLKTTQGARPRVLRCARDHHIIYVQPFH